MDGYALARLKEVVKINQEMIKCCEILIEALEKNPELDHPVCKAFGIQETPPVIRG